MAADCSIAQWRPRVAGRGERPEQAGSRDRGLRQLVDGEAKIRPEEIVSAHRLKPERKPGLRTTWTLTAIQVRRRGRIPW
jgi:hypothetical protein